MNCPNCQTANPDGAHFCFNCGAALSLTCDNCGTQLQPGAKFCHNCGQPVSATKAAPTSAQANGSAASTDQNVGQPQGLSGALERYIPKELLSKLEAAKDSRLMEGERRVVTILFCDVKGSTLAASHLDPEDWAEIINGAFEHMIQPIYRYEGTVARLQGDGLLAFFGAPIAHEDDPQRAILAGLDIAKATGRYGEGVKAQWGIDFNVRVGINTGLVVVGAVGSDLRVEYSALGDAINMAARMEQNAQPGTVLVAQPTYKLVARLFDFEDLEGLVVKGREEPVTAYRALGRKAEPGRLRGIEGLSSPLIGRKAEMDTLWSALNALKQGSGQIVSLIGEAGLGKSRLIEEFQQEVLADPTVNLEWMEGRSLSFETSTPFAPFINLFKDFFDIRPGDPDQAQYEQIRSRLERTFPRRSDEIAPFIATLIGIQLESEAAERVQYLEPPRLRGMIFMHVASLFEGLLASRPVILYLDDLHWADPTSLELLQSLLPLTDRAPLMIISAFRPRRQEPSWGFHEVAERDYYHRYQMIPIDPLDEGQSRELVANLLQIEDLPEYVRQKILSKSEGNPFFVEEIIRSLLDDQLVVRVDGHWQATQEIQNIDVPDTLVGVITARLDRLDDSTKQILQAAAVLGREFSVEILADVVESAKGMENTLIELQHRELVREKSRIPQRTFTFKHVLTQEAAYDSILLSNRRELHRRSAEALIARAPESAGDISRHLLAARQTVRAVPYLVQAGDKAAKAYATEEAIGYYRKAIELKSAVDDLVVVRRAYEGLGGALNLANQIPEAQDTFKEMLALAESAGDIPMQISALNKLAGITALRFGQFGEATQLLDRGESLSRKHGVKASIPESAILRCQMCTAQADFENVIEVVGEVIKVDQELGTKEHTATGLEHIASSLIYLTEFDEAYERAQEGLAVAREIGDRFHEAWLLSLPLPVYHMREGDFESARRELGEGLEIATRIGALDIQTIAAYLLAELAYWLGKYEQALNFGQRSLETALPFEPYAPFLVVPPLGLLGMVYLEISEEFTDKIAEFHLHALHLLESPTGRMLAGTAWADLGHCAIALGDLKVAEEVIHQGLNYPNTFMRLERPRHLAGAALLASTNGEHDTAARLAKEGRAYAAEREMRYLYPFTDLIIGKVLVAQGKSEGGFEYLEQAELEALDLGMRPIIWQARAESVDALTALGRLEQAETKRAAAKAMVVEIANLFEDRNLREAFLRNALGKIG
jgi:class 3 adenylate cyclase/tetratricopeptide (TPR) repeat protein